MGPFLNPEYETLMMEDGGLRLIGEGMEMTTEAPVTTTRSWLNPGFLGSIGAATEEGSGLEPEDANNYNQQYASTMDGWFPGREKVQWYRDEFDRLECRRHFLQAKPSRMAPIPKECEGLLYSISLLTFQGAWERPCECHNTGSNTGMCDKYYGGCECKTLVVGRQCDSCAPA